MGSKDWQEAVILSLLYHGVVSNSAHLARVTMNAVFLDADTYKGMKWFQDRARQSSSIKSIIESVAVSMLQQQGVEAPAAAAAPHRAAQAPAGNNNAGLDDRPAALKRKHLALSATMNKVSGKKRRRLLCETDGLELRKSCLVAHLPTPAPKSRWCFQCSYSYTATPKTDDNTWEEVRRSRKMVGRRSSSRCGTCNVHLCTRKTTCWTDFHEGKQTAAEGFLNDNEV